MSAQLSSLLRKCRGPRADRGHVRLALLRGQWKHHLTLVDPAAQVEMSEFRMRLAFIPPVSNPPFALARRVWGGGLKGGRCRFRAKAVR